jgi:hypothetical protein
MARTITNEQFDTEIQRLVPTTDRARDVALQRVERMRKIAGGAAVRELARRRARDGVDAVVTADAASRMLAQSRSIVRLRADLKIGRPADPATSDNQIATGRIVNGGRALPGARLVFTTEGGQTAGEAITDRSGSFVFERSREEFTRLVAGSRSLAVVITDAAGRDVFKTTMAIPKSGAMVINVDVASTGPAAPVDPRLTTPVVTPVVAPTRTAPAIEGIKGLGKARIAKLADAGVHDAGAVAELDPGELAKVLGTNPQQAAEIIAEAKKKAR